MPNSDIRYYILFANYDQGLRLHDLLTKSGVKNRIAPTPRSIQGKLSCGMSLLIEAEDIAAARAYLAERPDEYYDIVPLPNQIQSHRDQYC